MKMITDNDYKILKIDPWLEGYSDDINLRMNNYYRKKEELLKDDESIRDFAKAHHYYGFHKEAKGWVYREWAPAADEVYLFGDFNQWNDRSHPLERIDENTWEIYIDKKDKLEHLSHVKTIIVKNGSNNYRIPLFIKKVKQLIDEKGNIDFVGVIWNPKKEFEWSDQKLKTKKDFRPIIYEAHIGLAQDEEKIGSYTEFKDHILPRIKKLGYNTIQFMAIAEHVYYGSFGYHVTNYYAPSHWFGDPDQLKDLIDTAHQMGLKVIMDIVHSHASKNVNEGINRFDTSDYQFFYEDDRANHPVWDSKCFDYNKNGVLKFLLSNLSYWMEEYHFDGFRFDGVTSMIYQNHGIGSNFTSYDDYFSMNTNLDALTYLQLANELIKEINPKALSIAEDVSGMPGLCLDIEDGGIGFDYRFAMGIAPFWIENLKIPDENWNLNSMWFELTTKRPGEKRISYVESHDQALVGDKTLIHQLADSQLYWHMEKNDSNIYIERAMALHKLIRFITLATATDGYLNFIGNEFGHPEWIDFPSADNNWSFKYAKRQWHLADDKNLKYQYLNKFDKDMINFAKKHKLFLDKKADLLSIDQDRKLITYQIDNLIFLFNFHPVNSYDGLEIPIYEEGSYQVVFNSDKKAYGGYDRIAEDLVYETDELLGSEFNYGLKIYSPSRTVLVLKKLD